MAKINMTISVSPEVYFNFKSVVASGKYSEVIEEFMSSYSNTDQKKEDLEITKAEVMRLQAELVKANRLIKKQEEETKKEEEYYRDNPGKLWQKQYRERQFKRLSEGLER